MFVFEKYDNKEVHQKFWKGRIDAILFMEEKQEKRLIQEQRYERIIHARDFHYEQFNRWTSYFYVIIGALFIGYYTIQDESISVLFNWIILCVGYITSVANFLSIKGFIYWWQHWNLLLFNCEKELNDNSMKVYSVFADKNSLNHPYSPCDGSNISTSKVALLLAWCIVCAWSVLVGMQIYDCSRCDCGCSCLCLIPTILCSIIVVILVVLGTILLPKWSKIQSKINIHQDLELITISPK